MAGTSRHDLYRGQPASQPASQPFFFNLKQQHTEIAILTGLVLLCFLLFVRVCLRRAVAWRHMRRARHLQDTSSTQQHTGPAPPTWTCDKMQFKSRCYGCPNMAEQRSSSDDPNTSTPLHTTRLGRQQTLLSTRLPPAPPLTPPRLSTTVFACVDDVDGFISQPNPDYMTETLSVHFQNDQPARLTNSYTTKAVTIGAPGQGVGAASLPQLASPTAASQIPGKPDEDEAPPRRNVDVKGEIISLVNQDGEGWTRHTRVYGGGVCLACAASGGHQGGFYGATVTPEEMQL